jgi:hypothetical protein
MTFEPTKDIREFSSLYNEEEMEYGNMNRKMLLSRLKTL